MLHVGVDNSMNDGHVDAWLQSNRMNDVLISSICCIQYVSRNDVQALTDDYSHISDADTISVLKLLNNKICISV